MNITALTLYAANQLKAASPVPASVVFASGQFEVVSKLQTMTDDQRAGLFVAYEWHRAFNRSGDDATFNAIQFEIYGIKQTGRGPALANELRQLGVLQHHNGRYWLSPAGLNLVQSVSIENQEC